MTSALVVETSVTATDNSLYQDYPHPDDHTTRSTILLGIINLFCFCTSESTLGRSQVHIRQTKNNLAIKLAHSLCESFLSIFLCYSLARETVTMNITRHGRPDCTSKEQTLKRRSKVTSHMTSIISRQTSLSIFTTCIHG